jgi:transcriptional regulator with XRE-family HTH domain
MVAGNDHPSIPARGLAERLKDLREREYKQLTQKQLAKILGGSITMVSLWEKPGSNRLPPPPRLATYARLFCTGRSFVSGTPRLLRDDELTEQERDRESELYEELLALRERAQSTVATSSSEQPAPAQRNSIWHFPDGQAISVVCSDAPEPPPHADPSHLNYTRYARHADLDALMEVYGQVRTDNPDSMVRILPPEDLRGDFALNHLIIIGGEAVRNTEYFSQDIPLPSAPATGETYVFKCSVGEETHEFASLLENGTMLEDVGLIARRPHPIIPQQTVTMLFGITSRGVHGAALALIDSHVKESNEKYLREAFGDTEAFCVVMRIPIMDNMALPPNLWDNSVRLYEWSARTGARW